ncbi:MAG: type I restriction enzyme HsdR N-terminal domain-containing protein [Bacteroidales bacterium]|jgi:predicted type IV restriction endonuclease|nr:type I restriction enzyme HsdR N-terminal domain-containing protein [Bacteroidales bacterium]MDD2204024.1 type I restriction enzyme HsdR N-terminal domain-containing protein [Bacteroidales bacterium]MDD3152212.1 type I restriction enzyme HsdR N-terminal domain-containing protein [Bacteroidales bacterium]MDD3913388.1 type I restriction enzyme HsdR N-terminal domain-containing protein [Bacteroidales bacterium]MDD4633183.1 type I restriction enzyme HsdR N-terminal domain-containing protein [Bac
MDIPKIRIVNGKKEIFDPVRKIFIAYTSEEFVRQCTILMLNSKLNVPFSLMGVEKQIKVNNLSRRPDIVAFSPQGEVSIIVECKAPSVNIDEKTLNQIIDYNLSLHANYLILTNGISMYCINCKSVPPDFVSIDQVQYL